MGRLGADEVATQKSIRRVAFASLVGTAVEWYDFFVYGTAAALVFPKVFFPHFSALAGTLASFATFCVAFLARPIEPPRSFIGRADARGPLLPILRPVP